MNNQIVDNLKFSTHNAEFLTAEADSVWQPVESQHQELLNQLSQDVLHHLQRACILSPFVSEIVQREAPFFAHWLTHHSIDERFDYSLIRQQVEDDLQQASSDLVAKKHLRVWRARLFGLIAIRGLNQQVSIRDEITDVSRIADALILSAYDWLYPQFCQQWGEPQGDEQTQIPLLIVAMGKYGGFELNFSSDVDLIFYFSNDGETQGGRKSLEHQVFFTRLGQRLIDLLADVTRDGFVFRVDMRLRPYGESGPLAMSFDAAEDYYQEQGREWERFAMIKARVINEHESDSESFYHLIRPFVYRRYIDFGVLESIRSLKSKIETEIRRKGLQNNIKLGSGGIREAEFIVQSLQLVRGGRMQNLQQRSFVEAVLQLKQLDMLSKAIADSLLEAYLFLRKVEHVLQQIHDQQTQTLPESDLDRARLSQALGFNCFDEFYTQLKQHQTLIGQEFKALFHTEDEESDEADHFALELIERDDFEHWYVTHDATVIDTILKKVGAFVQSSHFQQMSSRGKSRLESLFPKLLKSLADEESPSITLERVLGLLRSITRRTAYLVLLEENPPVLEHLIKLCGQSKWVSEQLAEHPLLLDELLYPAGLYKPLMTADLKMELRRQLLRIEPDDEEQQQEQLRIFKQTHELRVAAAVLNNTIDVNNASRYLSQLAQAILDSVLILSWKKLCSRYGVPSVEGASVEQLKGFAVIAYGKFGGEELGFGSDLDLVFLFDADPEGKTSSDKPQTNSQFYTRLAQRIIHTLNIRTMSGVLYDVDMRLRPSGSSGLLVSLTKAFEDYQLNEAWTWEHQALTRARGVAGDPKLCQWFETFRLKVIGQERDIDRVKNDVITMRHKMRQSLDKSSAEKVDFKQCPGGIVDIEFIAQYLLLIYGATYSSENWSSRTTRQFHRLAELKVIDEKMSSILIEAYRFYRQLNNRQVLMGRKKQVRYNKIEKHSSQVKEYWDNYFGE